MNTFKLQQKTDLLSRITEVIEVANARIDFYQNNGRMYVKMGFRDLAYKQQNNIINTKAAIKKLQRYAAKTSMEIFELFPYEIQNQALAVDKPKVAVMERKQKPFISLDKDGSLY